MALLSPGVEIIEIDASSIVPTVSNSVGVFCGNFDRGPVGTYLLITNTDELITFFGKPSDLNFNDWYQAYNFLQYSNKLLVARAANTNGTATVTGAKVSSDTAEGETVISLADTSMLSVGQYIVFGNAEGNLTEVYSIIAIDPDVSITLSHGLKDAIVIEDNDDIYDWKQSINSVFEAVDKVAPAEAVTNDYEYLDKQMVIENAADFEMLELSIAFTNATDSKLKFIGRNPGNWTNDIEIAIATPDVFDGSVIPYAFDGIGLVDLFEYAPTGTEIGVVVKMGDEIVETFLVDFDKNAKDHNNKSIYVENVINNNSKYIFVKDNTSNTDPIKDYLYSTVDVETGTETPGTLVKLVLGRDSDIQADDLLTAYELFDNKEEVEIDIIIANELDGGVSAKNLVDTREDCIAFIGANYADTVGKKASIAVSKLIEWRKTGSLNFNDMFVVATGNYKYQYDRYNDKNRWINIAGDIAGLRAETSTNRASWFASAGLERGQLKNVIKIAFSPNQAQRDFLYKNGINPVVSFPGQGVVMWGQKTLLDKPSSFDRVNVRNLFNTLERALSKMAKYQVMEFNDNFTRNRIISMIKPYLGSVKAGRGIQDFLVICDESNNTPDVISRNNLVVDIYIKPTYVAEFIQLRFTNAGTNSFSEVIGG